MQLKKGKEEEIVLLDNTQDIMDFVKIKEAENKLTHIIGQSLIHELSQMSSTLEFNADNGLLLGCFNDKADRTLIHLNTRMVFPAIKTATVQQEGQYTLTANVDPVFLEFKDLIPEREDVENLMRFCHCLDKSIPSTYDLPYSKDKESRTKIHRLLGKNFGSFLESKTLTTSQYTTKDSVIQVRMRTRSKSRGQLNDKKAVGKRTTMSLYTGFVLRKENMETLEAIDRLAKCVGAHSSDFSYAGTKDKKAITLQNMVVRGVTPERLHTANSDPSLLMTGTYKIVENPLKMGQLRGNAFKIVIRDIQPKPEGIAKRTTDAMRHHVTEAVENTARRGFVNYFGHQRFGYEEGVATRACAVGLSMLQGNFMKAVKLLLMPDLNKNDDGNTAKRYYQETGDVSGTLSRMPHNKIRERLILKSLHRHGTDQDGCTKALFSIPYSLRLMYVHSYTSLMWNKMASQRLRENTGIITGDLVYDYNCAANITKSVVNESMKPIHDDVKDGDFKSCVRVVTDEDVNAKRFTIRDLVLPLPGYKVLYPTNTIGQRYQEVLASDGLTEKHFRLRSLALSLPGAYRKVIAVPKDLQYKLISEIASDTAASQPRGVTTDKQLHQYSENSHLPTQRSPRCSDNCNRLESSIKPITDLQTNTTEHLDIGTSNASSACDGNIDELQEIQQGIMEPVEKRPRLDEASELILDLSKDTSTDYKTGSLDSDVGRDNVVNSLQKQHGLTDALEKLQRLEDNVEIETHLEMSFNLNSSCYATVCLREMMKS